MAVLSGSVRGMRVVADLLVQLPIVHAAAVGSRDLGIGGGCSRCVMDWLAEVRMAGMPVLRMAHAVLDMSHMARVGRVSRVGRLRYVRAVWSVATCACVAGIR